MNNNYRGVNPALANALSVSQRKSSNQELSPAAEALLKSQKKLASSSKTQEDFDYLKQKFGASLNQINQIEMSYTPSEQLVSQSDRHEIYDKLV